MYLDLKMMEMGRETKSFLQFQGKLSIAFQCVLWSLRIPCLGICKTSNQNKGCCVPVFNGIPNGNKRIRHCSSEESAVQGIFFNFGTLLIVYKSSEKENSTKTKPKRHF